MFQLSINDTEKNCTNRINQVFNQSYFSHVCLLSSLLFLYTGKGCILIHVNALKCHNFEKNPIHLKYKINLHVPDQIRIVYCMFFLHKFFLNTFYNYIYCSHSTVYQREIISVTCTLNGVTIDSYLNVLVVTSHTQKQTQPSPPVDMRTRDSARAWGQNCRQTITTKCMHRTDK